MHPSPVSAPGEPINAWRQRLTRWFGNWVLEVNASTLQADLLAGLLGAALVLPQGIAFAALAGVPPAMGLSAAVLPCAVAALAGSSRHVLTGPTNATALALGAMLMALVPAGQDPSTTAATLVALSVALTLLVALMQGGLAMARLGVLANFISPSVMLGFTSGAALLIGWYALAGLLGGAGRQSPWVVWQAGVSTGAVAVGGLTLVAALAGRRWWRRGPNMLLAMLIGTVACWALAHANLPPAWQMLTQPGPSRVGTPPSAWPDGQALGPAMAALWQHGAQLLPMALALMIVALGQSLAIAKALAQRSGDLLDANRECRGQALANLVSGLGGGMVVCGSLNRSLPNLEAGARTPLAGVAAAVLLLVLVDLAATLLAWIPLAGVGALLLVVAGTLLDRAAWARLWRLERLEFGIALATALATLALRLEVAVLAGVVMSLVAYLYRSARPALRSMGFDRQGAGRPFVVVDEENPQTLPQCPQLKLLRMEGSVWFGAVPHVADHLRALRNSPAPQRHLLVMAKSMNTIDLAGADLWDDERIRRRDLGGDLYFHRPRPQVLAQWQRTGFLNRLGTDHVFPDKHRALATIVARLDPQVCATCRVRLFEECAERPGAPLNPEI